MLLSKSFDIIESLYSQRVYQDMTRYEYIKKIVLNHIRFSLLIGHYVIII